MGYNTINKEEHFTAILQIEKVTVVTDSAVQSDIKVRREPKEVAKIVVRAKTLEALKEKAAKHIDLVEEI